MKVLLIYKKLKIKKLNKKEFFLNNNLYFRENLKKEKKLRMHKCDQARQLHKNLI